MAFSETDLVNAALRRVGGHAISDIDDEVPSAGVARQVLALERDELLRSLPWNFAVTRVALQRLVSVPVSGFDYAYALPADCLRVLAPHDNDAGVGNLHYALESVLQADGSYVNAILASTENVWLRYVRQVTEVPRFSASFRRVLILKLAKIFAMSVATSATLGEVIEDELKAAMRSARSVDGIEDYPERLNEGSWAQSRGGTGWGSAGGWW